MIGTCSLIVVIEYGKCNNINKKNQSQGGSKTLLTWFGGSNTL